MKSTRKINEWQHRKYLGAWGDVRVELRKTLSPKDTDAQRKIIQAKALGGVEKSSKDLTNEELDEVLKAFRAISHPADFGTQMEDQAAVRGRYKVTQLRWALGCEESHVEALIARRHEGGALVSVHGAAAACFETIGPDDLERIALDLKEEIRGRWPGKDDLLNEVRLMRMFYEFDEATVQAEIERALRRPNLSLLHRLDYDDLLKVIATMRKIASAEVPF